MASPTAHKAPPAVIGAVVRELPSLGQLPTLLDGVRVSDALDGHGIIAVLDAGLVLWLDGPRGPRVTQLDWERIARARHRARRFGGGVLTVLDVVGLGTLRLDASDARLASAVLEARRPRLRHESGGRTAAFAGARPPSGRRPADGPRADAMPARVVAALAPVGYVEVAGVVRPGRWVGEGDVPGVGDTVAITRELAGIEVLARHVVTSSPPATDSQRMESRVRGAV